jgi:beta-lactamase regulating signal transducer with metallopeptidase domain
MSAMAWLSREEMVALGWALLHFCWQGTAVAVAFAVVDRMTFRATSKVRYVVALAGLMLMPVVVIGTFAEEMRAVTPARVSGTDFRTIPAVHLGVQPVPILHELPLASSLEEPIDWLKVFAERLLPWVDALWLAGVLLLAVRSLGGWWQLDQVRRRARTMVPEEVARGFQRISDRIHVGRQVALRISDEVISPLAMGVWRATVILPVSAVSGLPKDELEAVIAHELGHIRRCDYVWNLAQTAIESTLFFHPAVWWVSRTVRERREACCDEIAVQSCAGATVYARALLRLEEQRTRKLQLALALGGCGGSLLQRVRKVLGEESGMEDRMTSGVSVATAGALVLALLLGPKVGMAVAAPVVAVMHPAALVAEVSPATQANVGDIPVAVPAPAETPAIYSPLPRSARAPMVIASPAARVSPQIVISPNVAVNADIVPVAELELQEPGGITSQKGAAYLDGMRDAGYPLDLNNDLNSLVALKSLGVTPEYAKSMGTTGLGKPTVHELITLKSMGVTPEYVAGLRKSGIAPKDFHEVVTEKSLGVTPEYAAEMKQKGFGDLNVHELITMKSLGVTPEYAATMRQAGFGDLSVHDLVAMKSLGVTPEYAASMKQAGFGDLSVHELISLKAQGMTPEYARWLKQQFPQATTEELRRAAVFHLNDKFVADAKAHGFDGKDLNKLLRLKMSGLLDE